MNESFSLHYYMLNHIVFFIFSVALAICFLPSGYTDINIKPTTSTEKNICTESFERKKLAMLFTCVFPLP